MLETRLADALGSYVEADAAGRAARFDAFHRALKETAALDAGEARRWAARAVSPALDYSSLMKLGRFLPPEADPPAKYVVRIAVLGGPTLVQLARLIEIFLAGEEIGAVLHVGEYGLFRQEVLEPDPALDRFAPRFVFLATGARDVLRLPTPDMPPDAVRALVQEELADWSRVWEAARARWGATLIQNTFEISPETVFGHFALRHAASRENVLERLNAAMADAAPPHVILHDLRRLAAEAGAERWFDRRFDLEAKLPCGPECLPAYAHSVVSLIRAALGKSKKVLVLDLDNTLWGDAVGDVGTRGIRFGQGSAEGEAFLAVQQHAKALKDRGIVLAVCSKNDERNAKEPFETRDDMALKLDDISCFVASWRSKSENLREISERLGLPLDSFVLLDDDPAERAMVRRFEPRVAVPDLPADPASYLDALRIHRYFETVSFTAEDVSRGRYYAEDAKRKEAGAGAPDLAAFLRSLEMRARVAPVTDVNIERATQLINKSNQFNLTTRRYTIAEIEAKRASGDWRTLTISLRDRLGDSGLISVLLLEAVQDTLVVDTWVMSCRVLQRGVEALARNELARLAREAGARRIRGVFLPTAKNAMVRDHYAGIGFLPDGGDGHCTRWTLPVDDGLRPLDTPILLEA